MMILLTGGSACGKSSFAESLCVSVPGPRVYIAAMQPYGEEGEKRIEKHRRMRAGKGFETIECYTGLENLVLTEKLPELSTQKPTVLLECICNMTANEMFDDRGRVSDPVERVLRGVERLQSQSGLLVVVTNEVGSDTGNYSPETCAYIDAVGRINRVLAEKADAVYELVCGIPLVLKGAAPDALFGHFPIEGAFRSESE